MFKKDDERDFVEEKYSKRTLKLNKKEQIELLKKYKECKNPLEKERLRDELMCATWRFARSRARKFEGILGKSVSRQAAYTGLSRSFDKANLRKNSAITTIAHWWILFEIVRTIDNEVYPIAIPGNTTNNVRKKIKAVNPRNEDLSDSELLERIYGNKFSYKELRELLAVKQIPVSIDNVSEEGNNYNGEKNITCDDEELKRREVENDIERSLSVLTPKEKKVIINYYGLFGKSSKTMEEVGKMFINRYTGKPLTPERIRQILKTAKEKLLKSGILDDYKPIGPLSKPNR